MDSVIRVMVVDDHAIVREGIGLILETVDGVDFAGEASNGQEVLDRVDEIKPDVILMDLRMPVMDGVTAIQHLHTGHPEIAIVVLTTYNEDELMLASLQAGAVGYLLKDTNRQALIHAIEAAARGEALLQPEILSRVLTHAEKRPFANTAGAADAGLTEREMEILRAAAAGERTKEIAFRMGISARTVKAHLTSIYTKLGVDSRAGAIAVAAQRGLLEGHLIQPDHDYPD